MLQSHKTACYDMRSLDLQKSQPLVGVINFWDLINYDDQGFSYSGEFHVHNLVRRNDLIRHEPIRLLIILPESYGKNEWMANKFKEKLMNKLLCATQSSINDLGGSFTDAYGRYNDYQAITDPQTIFNLILLIRACSSIHQYPEMICLCRGSWILNNEMFKYNRYAVPPALLFPDVTAELSLWQVPIEILPPPISFIDYRHRFGSSIFIGSMPVSPHCIKKLSDYINFMNINVIFLIGDTQPSLEISENILEFMDYWERFSIHESITQRKEIIDSLWWRLRGRNRLLVMDINTGLIYSTSVIAYFLHVHLQIDPRSAAKYMRTRIPDANMEAIETYVQTDLRQKERSYFDKNIQLYDAYCWDEESSFGQAQIAEKPQEFNENVIVRKFKVEDKSLVEDWNRLGDK
eukprot:GHVH01016957.1.p1 GENE.GHVH01016957.1~~GHVH01016957.1.p1  ORF type:complete len:405 (-),score=50.18 GHVH01016957.1:1960-3174(-)